jgi:glutamine amidotransferase
MFHLALSFGLEEDVPSAIRAMVRTVEAVGKSNGIAESVWMTLGISDGKSLWGFRYGSNGKGPTLYISPDVSEIQRLNPEVADKLGDFAACLVSEPIGKYQELWQEIPEQSQVLISGNSVTVGDFLP